MSEQLRRGVVIEGVDGVGKSTLGIKLAKIIGARYMDAPYKPMLGSKSPVGEVGLEARYMFYRNANAATSWLIKHVIREQRSESTPVVLDKYQMSTVAFARAVEQEATWQDELWRPDTTIYLSANRSVRDARLDARAEKPRHSFEESGLLDRAAQEYERLIAERRDVGDQVIEIDTSELSPRGVLLKACGELGIEAS